MTDQATLEALDDIENGAWLLIYRKREALAALGELAFDPVRMPARNEEGCCWHPDLPGGVDLDASWQMSALGFDSHFVAMEHDADELYERYGEEGDLSMVTQWEPTSPGDGWKLAAIYDTEDGPHAMFVRRAELRDRLTKAEPACPHVVTSREGTSYCALAERGPAIVKAEPVSAEVRFKAVKKTLPGPWEFGQWQSANLASALKHPEPFVDDVGFLTEYRLLYTATPSISEAALLEALLEPTYYVNGNPVWYMPEIVAALRSLGIKVGP